MRPLWRIAIGGKGSILLFHKSKINFGQKRSDGFYDEGLVVDLKLPTVIPKCAPDGSTL
jgi:hypothetical protein